MFATPRIAAVIPVHNGRRFLRQSVESVLAQTLPPTELVIVDDGSTDESLAALEGIAAPFPLRVLRQPNAGQSAARNRAVQETACELIALLDQDDQWLPFHLERLAAPLRDQPWLGWTYSNLDEIDEAGRLVRIGLLDNLPGTHPVRDIAEMLRWNMHVVPSASLIRRDAFLAVGGFDERLSGYEDDDLFLRLFRRGYRAAYLRESTVEWRIWSASSAHSPRMLSSERVYAQKLIDEFAGTHYVPAYIAPRFLFNAMKRYHQAVDRSDWDACGEAREDALRFLALMPSDVKMRLKTRFMSQPRLHAKLVNVLRRMPERLRRSLSLY